MFRSCFDRIRRLALVVALGAAFFNISFAAFAQQGLGGLEYEPPLDAPKGNPPAKPDGIVFGEWVLNPTLRLYSLFDSNLYFSPVNPISATGFRINPDLLAQWTNGIHKTVIYGSIDSKQYPSESASNTFDRNAGVIQRYEALRDLVFTAQGDYLHKTNASELTGALPNPITNPLAPPVSPSGSVAINGAMVLNPYDQFTGLITVDKKFNRAFMQLNASISQTNYENEALTPDFTSKTFSSRGGVWLGPLLYAYASGIESTFTTFDSETTSKRILAGLGTAPIGLFRALVYAGHQGSQVGGSVSSGTAGGPIFGAKVLYSPTPFWRLTFSVDATENISNITSGTALAQTNVSPTIVLVPINASTRSAIFSGRSDYNLSKQWTAYVRLDYTRVDFINSSDWENAWLLAAGLRYELRRNIFLTVDYERARIVSDIPHTSARRDYIIGGTVYRF
jgi:opacity protein-like surface antigen